MPTSQHQPSQIILLSTRPGVLIQPPLHIAIFIFQCAPSNLEASHRHPWSHLCQLDALVSRLHEHMVPDLYAVIDILERHNSTSDFGSIGDGFPRGEDVFQYPYNSEAKSGCESFEYQVRVRFADSTARTVWNIMAKDHIVQGK